MRHAMFRLGIDRALAWVIVGRAWGLAAAPVTIFLIGTCLTPQQQGYYYTITNLLSMTMFFELGLGGWITRFASYEMARLCWSPEGYLTGEPWARERLSSLFRFSIRWYFAASFVLFIIVFPVGVFFFRTQAGSETISWQAPWLLAVLISSGNMALLPLFALLEGCGLVAQMVALFFARNLAGNTLLWASLGLGLGLVSSPALLAGGFLMSCIYLSQKRHALLDLWHSEVSASYSFDWTKELLPLQWRTALTHIFGYFAWQTANPILFKVAGAEEAGRLGISLNLAAMLHAFGMAWLNTKVPQMGTLMGHGDKTALHRLFTTSAIQAMIVLTVGSALALVCIIVMQVYQYPLGARFLPPRDLALVLVWNWLITLQYAFTVYVRTHKQEPFVTQMIFFGLLMPPTCYFTATIWHTTGMVVGMLAIALTFGVGWTWLIFLKAYHK
jgi:hypothetical protein